MPRGENKKLRETSDPLAIAAMSAGALVGVLFGAITGWIGYSAFGVNHRRELPEAMPGDRRTFVSPRAGLLGYYTNIQTPAGKAGRPLVLIHSINAAGSAYEMRPLYQYYRDQRPVYALDLPGFGFSDRSNRPYSWRQYTDAILDFLQTQVKNGPADVIALSLGSEFAARAALEHSDLVNSLTLISPSGFSLRGQEGQGSQRARRNNQSDWFYRLFAFPLWSQAFYDLLATPTSIKYFLKQSFEGPVDKGLVDYAYATSHQLGAKYAPLYFVSGKLFSPDIREEVYEKLTIPVQVLYDRDNFVRFDTLSQVVNDHANWRAVRIAPTKGLPQFEQLDATVTALNTFWQT